MKKYKLHLYFAPAFIAFVALSFFIALQIAQAVGTGSGSSPTPDAEPAPAVELVAPTPDPVVEAAPKQPAELPAVVATPDPEPTPDSVPTPAVIAEPVTTNGGNCTTADYECGEWGECESTGIQKRECTLPASCNNPGNLIPRATEQQCEEIKCLLLDTIEKRITCRLDLSPEQLQAENDLQYLPEYCRIETEGEERDECIELYKSFDTCWAIPAGKKRRACANGILGTVKELKAEKESCLNQNGPEREVCKDELGEKVEHKALFNMYELEFLSEQLWKAGRVTKEEHIELVLEVEARKAGLELAKDAEGWKKEIQDLQTFWEGYREKVM